MELWAPESKNGFQKPRETPPKMVSKTFVSCIYHFWAGFWPILKNRVFRAVLGPFSPYKRAKNGFGRKGTQKLPWGLVFWLNDLQIGPTKVFWGPTLPTFNFGNVYPPPSISS